MRVARLPVSLTTIHRWVASGALGDRHRPVGSGFRHDWTEHELWKIGELGRLARDLMLVCGGGGGLRYELVARVWAALDDPTCDEVRVGSVVLVLRRPVELVAS